MTCSARHPADQIGGDLGDIGEGLVPDVRELGDDLDRLGIADVDGRVVRSEVGGDRSRLGRLVEGAVGETDGECAHGPRAMPLHQGHDGAGVDPPGEERSHRDVGDHPGRHRVRQRVLELVDHLRVRDGQWVSAP